MNEVYNLEKDISDSKELLFNSVILTVVGIIILYVFSLISPNLSGIDNIYEVFRIFFVSILVIHYNDNKTINNIVVPTIALLYSTYYIFYLNDYVAGNIFLLITLFSQKLFTFSINLTNEDDVEKDLVVYKNFLEEFHEEMLKSENREETLRIYTEDMYDNFD